MNAVKKLAIVLSLGALASVASAATSAKAYVASYAGVTDMPVPVKVVAPAISADRGAKVVLEFVIDTEGVPQGITVHQSNDDELAQASIKAVKRWRFAPRSVDGQAVKSRARLPIMSESALLEGERFAMN